MESPTYSNKWVRMFLRLAREYCEFTDCGSRNVGCVLVRDKIPIAFGKNGPPSKCENNSKRINLIHKLGDKEHEEPWYDEVNCIINVPMFPGVIGGYGNSKETTCLSKDPSICSLVQDHMNGKNICPRKLLGYGSTCGYHICSCNHAERNAIAYAAREGNSTNNSSCFLYPFSPCKDCVGILVAAGVREIYTLRMCDDKLARIILEQAGISVFLVKEELLEISPDSSEINNPYVTQYK